MISNWRTGSARWQVRRSDASVLAMITSAVAEVSPLYGEVYDAVR